MYVSAQMALEIRVIWDIFSYSEGEFAKETASSVSISFHCGTYGQCSANPKVFLPVFGPTFLQFWAISKLSVMTLIFLTFTMNVCAQERNEKKPPQNIYLLATLP